LQRVSTKRYNGFLCRADLITSKKAAGRLGGRLPMTMVEYITKATITNEMIQRCVLDFLIGSDCALAGAWAVNLYSRYRDEDERMTADIDFVTTNGDEYKHVIAWVEKELGTELKIFDLSDRLYRLYAKDVRRDRPIVDIMIVSELPQIEVIDQVPVVGLEEMIKMKEAAIESPTRPETKRLMDQRDRLVLLDELIRRRRDEN